MNTVTQNPDAVTIDFADPAAVAAEIARIDAGRWYQDASDPTDYTPVFQPTAADDQWNAATSPLNHADDDAEMTDAEWFAYEPLPADWSEYEAWSCASGALCGHADDDTLDN